MTVLTELAERGRDVADAATPDQRTRAALYVLDSVGCAVAGLDHPLAGPLAALVRASEDSALVRVLAEATLLHVDELDAIHAGAAMLPCATVVPAALEFAAQQRVSGARLLTAVTAGADVAIEAGLRFGGSARYASGWFPTALFGGLGAAAAGSVLLDLDGPTTTQALALVASGLGGLLSADILGGGHYLLVGRAAATGLHAALAARAGLTASTTLLDGPASAALGVPPAPPSAGSQPHLLDAAVKSYPCARPLHAMIEALLSLAADGTPLAEIRSVRVGLPTAALRFVTTERTPAGPTEAAASAPYAVAAVLADRATDPAFFRDAVDLDPIPEVSVYGSGDLDAAFPRCWGAEVEIVCTDGRTASTRVRNASGGPDAPLPEARIVEKFGRLVGNRWPAGDAAWWAESCRQLDDLTPDMVGRWSGRRPRLVIRS